VVTADLRDQANLFEQELGRAHESGGARLTHPFFGHQSAPEALRFVAVHAAHHRRQLPGAVEPEARA
jgi:hypothetical protein